MAAKPGEAAIGVGGLGLGILLIYAAFKNAPVLGPDGMLTSAFTTGKLPSGPKVRIPANSPLDRTPDSSPGPQNTPQPPGEAPGTPPYAWGYGINPPPAGSGQWLTNPQEGPTLTS